MRLLLSLLVVLSAGAFAAQETIIQSVAGGGNLSGYTPNKAAISLNNTAGLAIHPVTQATWQELSDRPPASEDGFLGDELPAEIDTETAVWEDFE